MACPEDRRILHYNRCFTRRFDIGCGDAVGNRARNCAATLIVTAIILILLARSLQFGFVAFVVLFFFLNWPSMLFDLESPFSAFSPIMGFSGFYQPYEKLEVLTMTLCVHGAVSGMLYPFSRAATR